MAENHSGPGDPGDQVPDECTWCDRAPGLIVLLGGVVLVYMGVDLVTGGWLTRLLVGAARNAGEIPGSSAATVSVTSEPAAST